MRRFCLVLVLTLTCCAADQAVAEDWPQWRGVDRTDRSQETNLLTSWPSEGPSRLWLYRNAGVGYSGPSIVDGRMYSMGARDGATYMFALDAETGQELWSADFGPKFKNAWGHGPRCTPTYDEGWLYGLSGKGQLACISAKDGQVKWKLHLVDDLGGRVPQWGYCESVLVDGPNVICTPGGDQGAVAAINKDTGSVVWRSESTEPAQYSSVVATEYDGVRHYIQLFMKKLVSISPDDGSTRWQVDWPGRIAVVPTPIVVGNQVYVSAGYGVGCMLVNFTTNSATEVYDNKVMKNHHGGVIESEGRLFGYSDKVGWVCQNFQSGKLLWRERRRLGKGAVAFANGQLYCVEEDSGEVVLVDATEEKWQERGRFVLEPQTKLRKPQGRIWTHPVISNGRLYLRDQDLIYCYDIRQRN